MLPASKTGTLSAAAVARQMVMRSEAVGHAGLAVLSNGHPLYSPHIIVVYALRLSHSSESSSLITIIQSP
jgi:hypothetical protein